METPCLTLEYKQFLTGKKTLCFDLPSLAIFCDVYEHRTFPARSGLRSSRYVRRGLPRSNSAGVTPVDA